MTERIGRILFRYRNGIGPAVFLFALAVSTPVNWANTALERWMLALGIAVAVAGQAIRIVTIGLDYIERGGRNREVYASTLVQGGVFNHCRNPLYLGNILMCVGIAIVAQSWVFLLGVLPAILLAYSCIVAAEEAYLRERFGAQYAAYCARVPRWLPRAANWRESTHGMAFDWQRVLVKEYNTMMLFVLAVAVVASVTAWRRHGPQEWLTPYAIAGALLAWSAVYLVLRWLKKSGTLSDRRHIAKQSGGQR
jgi:protein-S-isoprenylcysteine O-methyltransferase Ste14